MYISAQKFVDVWTKQGWSEDDLWSYLASTRTLLKKYGSSLSTQKILSVVEKYDASLSWFIGLLHRVNKCSLKHVATIWSLLSTSDDWLWSIRSSHPDRVWSVKEWIVAEQQESVWLTVQWAWKIYKRSLDRDMNKLLG